MFSLVIFDCDGVLVDCEPITNRVFAAMINELGVPAALHAELEAVPGIEAALDALEALGLPVGRRRPQSMSKLHFSSGMTVVFLTNLWPR